MRPIRVAAPALLVIVLSAAGLGGSSPQLTFEQRVAAQRAIERVYYSHQAGTTRPFDEALPREVLEQRVRTYLQQSVALEVFWKAPVTAEALRAELRRISNQSQLPARLDALYTALGNDPFLIQECLARPILVDRLSRSFFDSDERIHGRRRGEAERLRDSLVRGDLAIETEHPARRVVEIVRNHQEGRALPIQPRVLGVATGPEGTTVLELPPGEFSEVRGRAPEHVGEVGPVQEEPGAFVIRTVLADDEGKTKVAIYAVRKTAWEEWWREAQAAFDEEMVAAVASATTIPPLSGWRSAAHAMPQDDLGPRSSGSLKAPRHAREGCSEGDGWDDGLRYDVPGQRTDHSAVWTGSYMIIWGGIQGREEYATDTGARYDPVLDTWGPISVIGAPPPSRRRDHSAVWTGREMIVISQGIAARYDPADDTWTAVPEPDVPEPLFGQSGHTSVWTGKELITWGGLARTCDSRGGSCADSPTNRGGRYDPETDSWRATSTLGAPEERSGHTAVWTGEEMIVWGPGSSGGRYDPTTDTWRSTSQGDAEPAVGDPVALWTGQVMFVWGSGAQGPAGGRYDPASDRWAPVSTLGAPGTAHSTAVWTGEQVILWECCPTNTVAGGRYDPVTDVWMPLADTNAPRSSGHTAVWTGSLMVVFGGFDTRGGRYDPGADAWTPVSPREAPPYARGGAAQSVVWTGSLMVVWGGYDGYDYSSSGGRYDPVTDSWSPTSLINAPWGTGGWAIWTGDLMVIRGNCEMDGGGRYDPLSDTWHPVSIPDWLRERVEREDFCVGLAAWGAGTNSGPDGP